MKPSAHTHTCQRCGADFECARPHRERPPATRPRIAGEIMPKLDISARFCGSCRLQRSGSPAPVARRTKPRVNPPATAGVVD